MRLRTPLALAVLGGALAATSAGAVTTGSTAQGRTPAPLAAAVRQALKEGALPAPRPRAAVPQDRYAPAGGCYAVQSRRTGRWLTRSGGTFTATATSPSAAEPFRFQALDLGKYLLFGSRGDFLATASDPLPVRLAGTTAAGYAKGVTDETENGVREPLQAAAAAGTAGADAATLPVRDAVRGNGVTAAAAPSAAAEWVLRQRGSAFVLQQAYDDGDEATPGPLDPPIADTLTTTGTGALQRSSGATTGTDAQLSLRETTGCHAWPEAPMDISGPVRTGATPYEQVQGYLDAHLHMMAFEFLGGRVRCGRPWHPYGITYALVDCPDHGPGGHGSALEDVLSGKTPGSGHDTVGWPSFGYWPNHESLTHEQVYYQWLERAWRGGLRMFTNLLVENGQLCQAYPLKKNSCDEMDSVRLQAQRLRELERYVDAQSGGPGRGWFRIVTDPLQARRAINAGRLAVVMGIEVSRPLGCRELQGQPTCTEADIANRLQQVYDLGVRQMEMTNKFDNALTGVTGDSGSSGIVVNEGNKTETGHFWEMTTCQAPFGPVAKDQDQYDVPDQSGGQVGRDAIFSGVLQVSGRSGVVPLYPAGPHCNAIGLSPLGKVFLRELMKHGMVFDPDHMSALARKQALDFVQAAGYSGVVSSHSWADDTNYFRILTMGGVVTPHAGGSAGFLGKWELLRRKADPRFLYGIGWGSDINGFSAQGAPRHPAPGQGVTYPFTGLGGTTVQRARTGTRTWDLNTDGLDQYGQYPDWVQDVKVQAGPDGAAFQRDVANGAEAYLQMWERALGAAGDSCRADVADLRGSQVRGLGHGLTPEQVLARLGQPHQRVGSTFTYCTVDGKATIRFDRAGRT